MQSLLDGDSFCELRIDDLAHAADIHSFTFDELVHHACERLDQPSPVDDFPYGQRDKGTTWRELITTGEESHPVWLAALERAVR